MSMTDQMEPAGKLGHLKVHAYKTKGGFQESIEEHVRSEHYNH